MEEQQRRRLQASAPALLIFLGGGGGGRGAGAGNGAGGREDRPDDAARGSGSCNLCGDVGFREALLPCGARGCSRLQHTYCGSRYCPDVVSDVNRWRCEWCAREDSNRRLREEGGEEGGEEEREDSSSKRSRRAPPARSLSPPDIKQQQASSSPERSADRQGRTACHREDRRGSTSPGARPHAPPAASPAGTDVPAAAPNMMITTHRDKQSINTRSSGGGGGGSRALDRWKNLAKRTRLGGKKYKLLADVLC